MAVQKTIGTCKLYNKQPVGYIEMFISGPRESFFKNPASQPSSDGDGILYHLRRDLVKLYGPEDQYEDTDHGHVMLAMLGICVGIDYLSKIYSNQSGRKGFVETTRDLCDVGEREAEAIYQFRCALVHSLALSTMSDSYRKGTRFIFNIADDTAMPLIESIADTGSEGREVTYRIGFRRLKQAFVGIVEKLEEIARTPDHARNAHVINKIGQMHVEKILKM
jgi:hypothetical protein